MGRWVEQHRKCKGRAVNIKDNNDFWSHNFGRD
jgi:hypothetical protein